MTPEQYYAAIRRLGLKPSNVATVFFDLESMPHNIPLAEGKTPEQLLEILTKIRTRLGVFPKD